MIRACRKCGREGKMHKTYVNTCLDCVHKIKGGKTIERVGEYGQTPLPKDFAPFPSKEREGIEESLRGMWADQEIRNILTSYNQNEEIQEYTEENSANEA